MNTNTETKAGLTCAKCGCVNLDSDEMHGDFCLDCAKAGELTGSRHTPGPWRWEYTQGAGLQIFGQVPFKANCVEFTLKAFAEQPLWSLLAYEKWLQFPPREWTAMQEANARLIAAAPELFEAAKESVANCYCAKCAKVRAIIAKVEGGAS